MKHLAIILALSTFVSAACKPTTLMTEETMMWTPLTDVFYLVSAHIEVRGEGKYKTGECPINSDDIGDYYTCGKSSLKIYKKYSNDELTYTSNGRSQFLTTPVKSEIKGTNRMKTYYGCI
ncbi:hypothetical protein BGZ97_009485 [Linnemannia gamsii]|jgi:hypothetical protein|uniref:Uncharacterized protein n=1 Tax=Linnemannia gamsii TaxID=64522 RepID=A0A9P6QL34_9FUNG|nr:hypothetical protein BGZ97_009485 [Linnemannia gamsii]